MKITVLMPAYNAQAYLQEAIDSVLGQDLSGVADGTVELELICVDDASTDNTAQILDKAAQNDNRVRVVHRPINGGEGPARASGMQVATGDWLLCLDADDLFIPGSLARFAKRLVSSQADVVLYRFRILDNRSGAQWDCDDAWQIDGLPADGFDPREYADRLYTRFWSSVCNKALRISFLRSSGITFPLNKRIGDVPLMLPAISAARRVELVDEFCYLYRVNVSGNLTSTGDSMPLSFLDACRELKTRLESLGLWETYRVGFLNWLVENLPYNLQTMHSLEGYRALLDAFCNGGFTELGLDTFTRREAANPWAWDHVQTLRTQDTEHGLFDFMQRLNNYADEQSARAIIAQQQSNRLNAELIATQKHRDALAGSVSLRVGRALTAPLRGLRDLLRRK